MDAKRRRPGRPVVVPLSLDEAASRLGWDPESLGRLLQRSPGVLPGAALNAAGEWAIPGAAIRAVLGVPAGPLPPMCSMKEAAAFMGKSVSRVSRLLRAVCPETGKSLLVWREVLGSIRIDVRSVLALPTRVPDWAAPSFFSEGGMKHG